MFPGGGLTALLLVSSSSSRISSTRYKRWCRCHCPRSCSRQRLSPNSTKRTSSSWAEFTRAPCICDSACNIRVRVNKQIALEVCIQPCLFPLITFCGNHIGIRLSLFTQIAAQQNHYRGWIVGKPFQSISIYMTSRFLSLMTFRLIINIDRVFGSGNGICRKHSFVMGILVCDFFVPFVI